MNLKESLLSELRERKSILDEQVFNLSKEKEKLSGELNNLKDGITDNTNEIGFLEQKIKDKRGDINYLNHEIKERKLTLEKHDIEIEGNVSIIDKLENKKIKMKGIDNIKFCMNLFGKIKTIEKSDGKRIIAGYGNIAVVDTENQLIPIESLRKGLETLMSDPSYANLMLVHKNIQIGKIIEEYGDLKTHVDDKGLFIVAEIRKDIKIADKVWDDILEGNYNGFSIGCEVLGEPNEKCDVNGENCIEVLSDINIFEVSVCSQPVNDMSGFVVVSKSRYNNGDLLNDDVCNECNINSDNMSKKKAKSKAVEEVEVKKETEPSEADEIEDKTTEELSVDDRIKNIERTISNIEAVLSKLNEPVEEDDKGDDSELCDECGDETKGKEDELPTDKEPPKEEEKSDEVETVKESEKKPDPVEEKDSEPKVDEWKQQYDDLKSVIEGFASDISTSISEITNVLKKKEEKSQTEELEMAVKARDDEIEALKKKVTIYEKSRDKENEVIIQKTVQDDTTSEDIEIEMIDDVDMVIERGIVSSKKFVY